MINEVMASSNNVLDEFDHVFERDMTPTIVPMAESSVQRIVAGQAVVDLASAVKELVDNSLDAGAKSINIRLFGQGIDVLEVSDDGCGVPFASRPYLAMKHATSKIRSFDDIYSGAARSLGFRGEALFCLANISQNLVIATRTEQDPIGQKMRFGADGTMIDVSVTSIARKVGTTVAVVKLFHNLPVRRSDMIKRIKAQRAKLLSMIQGYAVLCKGIRFNLIDIVDKTFREDVRLCTSSASTTVEQTVSSVMGSKFLSGMAPLSADLSGAIPGAKLEGLISKAPALTARDGFVAREAQCFSINGRPVELPRLSRLLSEAWRAIEGTKKRPACVLCLTLPFSEYDVNLSPNKREVLVVNESTLFTAIQTAVSSLWASQTEGNFAANEVHLDSTNHAASATETPEDLVVPTSTSAESPGTPFRRAKRRNAFVHDFRNVRLQHEEDDMTHQSQHDTHPVQPQSPSEAFPGMERIASISTGVGDDQPQTQKVPCPPVAHASSETFHGIGNAAMGATEGDGNLLQQYYIPSPAPLPATGTEMGTTYLSPELDNDANESQTKHVPGGVTVPRTQQTEPYSRLEEPLSARMDTTIDRPSDEERVEWASAQSRFNHDSSQSQREEIDQLRETRKLPASDTEEGTSTVTQSEQGSDGQQDWKIMSGRHHDDLLPRKKSLTLEDLAFHPLAAASRASPGRSKHKLAVTSTSTWKSTSITRSDAAGVSPPQTEVIIRKRAPVILSPDKFAASGELGHVSFPDVMSSKQCSTGVETANEIASPVADASDAECNRASIDEHDVPPVWNWTTEAVIGAAKESRVKMKKLKIQLRTVAKGRKTQSLHKKEGSEAGVGNSVGFDDSSDKIQDARTMDIVRLSKSDFDSMDIVGQFNLGFILAKCCNNHLWILDQHACDEKFNFERLCRDTIIHEQKLLAPMPLELSVSEESCILENLDIFEKNGFGFQHNPDRPPRHRLSLTALPHSGAQEGRKAVQFGKEDVRALCSILGTQDYDNHDGGTGVDGSGMYGNNAVRRYAGSTQSQLTLGSADSGNVGNSAEKVIARLPKAIAMFANRACRGSIMIGTALSAKEMETVVRRLSDVDHPWNCPHGRPSMRHVRDTQGVLAKDEAEAAEYIAGPTISFLSLEPLLSEDDEEGEPTE